MQSVHFIHKDFCSIKKKLSKKRYHSTQPVQKLKAWLETKTYDMNELQSLGFYDIKIDTNTCEQVTGVQVFRSIATAIVNNQTRIKWSFDHKNYASLSQMVCTKLYNEILRDSLIQSCFETESDVVSTNQFHLNKDDKILILGESDFSFTLSLIENEQIKPENIISTMLKETNEHIETYEGETQENYQKLLELHGTVSDKCDATNELDRHVLQEKYGLFDKILFTFPRCVDSTSKIYIPKNEEFLLNILKNMKELLTSKTNSAICFVVPFHHIKLWNIDQMPSKCGLTMKSQEFKKEQFAGYKLHREDGKKVPFSKLNTKPCIISFSLP